MKKNSKIIIWLVIVLIVGVGILALTNRKSEPGQLDGFASCLKERGATFYGAFWCSHCQNQKNMFGKSQKFLPYVECSTPNGNNQSPLCTEKNITGYPAWEFADGSREFGEISLKKLAEKTGCLLP